MRRVGGLADRHPFLATMLGAMLLGAMGLGSIGIGRALDDETPPVELTPGSARLTTDQLAELRLADGDFFERLKTWCDYLDFSTIGLASLPRGEDAGLPTQPVATLAEAVDSSPIIIPGRVRAWRKEGCNVFALVDVERGIGTKSKLVQVWIGWMVLPGRDWNEAYLVDSDVVHTSLPGEEVVLLLEENHGEIMFSRGVLYHSLSFTSSYRVNDGQIEALPRNPFVAEVDGLPVDEFWAQLFALRER